MGTEAESFEERVIRAKKPALVDFWGSWCIPCKQMEPILEALRGSRPDLEVLKVNVNRNPRLASQYRIMGVPTLVLFQDGEERGRAVGAHSLDQLTRFIEEHLG